MSTAFSDACIHYFPRVLCNLVKSFCVIETAHQTIHWRFVWHRRVGKCIPKLILASYVRTRRQVVFDNEHSLHLWKRHPCTSNAWRQLLDWREQVTTWRDVGGLLYRHNNIVCSLIQSNCIELQPSITILIWVAWLLDQAVCNFIIYVRL
jgi:hypothetical protein